MGVQERPSVFRWKIQSRKGKVEKSDKDISDGVLWIGGCHNGNFGISNKLNLTVKWLLMTYVTKGQAPTVRLKFNQFKHNKIYLLVNDIYPRYCMFFFPYQ